MAGKNYYDILGIKKDAAEQDIKTAYRRLARKYHPDVNPGNASAEARFKEINEAYEVLSDKDKRQKYDQYGDQWQYADQFARAGNAQPAQSYTFTRDGSQAYFFGDTDVGSIFGDLFQHFRPGSARGRARARRGQNAEYPIEITLEEAYQGTTRLLDMQVQEPCATCGGSGYVQNIICGTCQGSGRTSRVKRLEVKVPAGVNDGARIRMAGQGGAGSNGRANGDLYLVVTVKPHPLFERKDNDLYLDIDVPLTVAMLGGEVQVPTPKGKLALRIPPETQNGRSFRLAGQGMPHLGNSARGDLLAKVRVVLPTGLSNEERKLFEQMRAIRPGS